MTPEETLARLRRRVEQEIPLLTGELLSNLKEWREAQASYSSARRELVDRGAQRGQSRLLADQRASVHPEIRDAITYTTYYRDQSAMCAAALTALRGVREDLKQR